MGLAPKMGYVGVAGGVRTLGHWNHNPALYRLSYSHRIIAIVTRGSSHEIRHRVDDGGIREVDQGRADKRNHNK